MDTAVDTIFSGIGGIFDGARSVLGDILEFRLLEAEVANQQNGTSNPPATTSTPQGATAPAASATGMNLNPIVWVGAGIAGIGVLALILRG